MRKLFLVLLCLFVITEIIAQRQSDHLDRGVVAVRNSSGQYFVSWRLLASDPDNIHFNLYSKNPVFQTSSKLNPEPLSNTNFQSAAGQISNGSEVFVKPVIDGMEGDESIHFKVSTSLFNQYRSAYLDISFDPSKDGLELHKYNTKFIWPADLDGDGEYDYVVDRLSTDGSTDRIQAYLRDGTLLWTINPGPNVPICRGSSDMLTAYDMDGDGKAEVLLKSSDGTQFANNLGVNASSSLDTDDDGIVNYELQSSKNPPMFISVIDGMTGIEKTSIEFDYSKTIYTRTNKADFMGDEYNKLSGHMGILYTDGKHPDLGYIYMVRTSAGSHIYYVSAWGYNEAGQFVEKYTWARGSLDAAEAHGLRIADVDFDGRDEMLDIGYGVKYDGTLTFNAHLSHGDRFRTGDIDPSRPGLETFAIQQNASDMLGMILYEAHTGIPIKKWYMNSVGDVGRGECMDVDSTRLGFEMWSTMPNIYDAKGNVLYEGSSPWPYEGIWWDGDLVRETLAASDGNGFNADIRKYDINAHTFGSRPIEFAKMTAWQVKSEYGVRPAFFGDIMGDWREEVILEKKASVTIGGVSYETCPGFVGFSTDYPTSIRQFCLMQNPAYRLQCTAKGYYQSSIPDFYLGHGMAKAPLPPVMKTKLYWNQGVIDKASASWLLKDEKTSSTFVDGDDIMFDISGKTTTILLTDTLKPSRVYAMNPLGKDYSVSGKGKFTGEMELIKSMKGNFTLNGNHDFTGTTRISDGTLTVNGSLNGPVVINANGTLAGNAVLNGELTIEKSLHLEGGRIAPGNGLDQLGKIILNQDLTLSGNQNLHFDIVAGMTTGLTSEIVTLGNDSILVNGTIMLSGVNHIILNSSINTLGAGTLTLMQWTDSLIGGIDNFSIKGISGLPAKLVIEDKSLKLVVSAVREKETVTWTGSENGNWDYESLNFISDAVTTHFVSGDTVILSDNAVNKTIMLTDRFEIGGLYVTNNLNTFTLKGTGGFSGAGDLIKSGHGLLNIETSNNDYTGKTILENAQVQITALNDAGTPGSLGMAAIEPSNIHLNNSKLLINATSTNTNRGMTFTGNDTLSIVMSTGTATITGILTGSGSLVKSGLGQLNLSGDIANSYSGGTVIEQGTVSLGSIVMNNKGLGTGAITLGNGSKLNMYYSTAYGQNPSWNLIVPQGNNATLITSGRCDINGTFSGGGTLNYYVSYVRTDLVASGANFTGRINVTTDTDGGDFRITKNSIGFPLAQINLNGKIFMAAYNSIGSSSASASTAVKIGSLSGTAASTLGTGTWTIGSDNRDAIFAGIISSGATITKSGTGTWTLTGSNATTGVFNINEGTLNIENSTGSATGTSTVYVKSGAKLSGNGTISGGTVINSGGTLSPGDSTTTGMLTFGSNLVANTGSKIVMKVYEKGYDKLKINSTFQLKGTLELQKSGANWEAGNSYTLFEASTILGTPEALIPEKPAPNLAWNLSQISDGIISIDVADGISEIAEKEIKIYPNLVMDAFYVRLPELNQELKLCITDLTGKELYWEDLPNSLTKINISSFKAGAYIIKIQDNQKLIFTTKILKK